MDLLQLGRFLEDYDISLGYEEVAALGGEEEEEKTAANGSLEPIQGEEVVVEDPDDFVYEDMNAPFSVPSFTAPAPTEVTWTLIEDKIQDMGAFLRPGQACLEERWRDPDFRATFLDTVKLVGGHQHLKLGTLTFELSHIVKEAITSSPQTMTEILLPMQTQILTLVKSRLLPLISCM